MINVTNDSSPFTEILKKIFENFRSLATHMVLLFFHAFVFSYFSSYAFEKQI